MSRALSTTTRLLRLRSVQRRIASASAAHAVTECANLEAIAARIEGLRRGLGTDQGHTGGTALRAMTEMADRLDTAQAGLIVPIIEASERSAQAQRASAAANDRQERAATARADAATRAEADRDRRDDANRPYRKRASMIGDRA